MQYRLFAWIIALACFLSAACYATDAPHSLVVGEGFVNPIGHHETIPTFSWKLPEATRKQSAYRIEVTATKHRWDSGWVVSDRTTFVPYAGDALNSRDRATWRVQFRDDKNEQSPWSEPAAFELGLLANSDWKARWIHPSQPADTQTEVVGYLRRAFEVNKPVKHARLYVTAKGLFELELNGERVGKDVFANGWTSYANRIDTLTYDVTRQVKRGSNAISSKLGSGWYTGRLAWGTNTRFRYGKESALLLQLEMTHEDGSTQTLVSDGSWEGTFQGPIIASSIYDGESFDARREVTGWAPVTVSDDLGTARLIPKPFAPVRAVQFLPTQKITEPQPGRYVFDLGQNIVGWPRLRIPAETDQTTTVRFAEMLKADGTLYTENYRSAKSINTYTAAKAGTVEWEPHFTFHGFRYVELSGLPAGVEPQTDWVTGVVLHSALQRIGRFESSHAKLNQLQSNIVWGLRGNFVDIPTDCPQRDERLGWTGDAQVFAGTASFNYDCLAFWKSWLGTMRDDQWQDGRIPHVIPDLLREAGSPGWMDAATIIPWEVYVRTGDIRILSENFAMMEKLVGWYRSKATGGLVPEIQAFGDWLQPYAPKTEGETPSSFLATAFYAYSTQLTAQTAKVLKKESEARQYEEEAAAVRKAFHQHYFGADGKLQNMAETQTAYVLSIAFKLIPKEIEPAAAKHLVRLIQDAGGHLRTGFLGTPYIVQVLEESGHPDVAFSVLFKETYPSWFYTINQGATTMWERWNSYSHDKGFGDAGMNSFNHYAYGAIGQWLYERLAGLAPDSAHPGYKHFFIKPSISSNLSSARAELETPYGKAVSGWEKQGNELRMEITVPPNTTATIVFPADRPSETVAAGTHRFVVVKPRIHTVGLK